MKRFLLATLLVLVLSVPVTYAENVFYKSAMHLVASVPNTMDIEKNTKDHLQLSTPDGGFTILAISFSLKEHTRKELLDGMYQLASEATVDLTNATYINLDTKTLHGLIAGVRDDAHNYFSYVVCDDGEHAYIIQVAARKEYTRSFDRFLETLEYYIL